MTKILILRTFSHTRIWEGGEPFCHYERHAHEIIKDWEPNLPEYTLDEIPLAMGFYTENYFTYRDFSGQMSFIGTPEEEQPSFLQLTPINIDSNSFATDNGSQINIAFRFLQKITGVTREEMIAIDKLLVKLKKIELGLDIRNTRNSSLCFTIDADTLSNYMNQLSIDGSQTR